MKSRSLWRKRKDVMKFNDKEAESKVRQEAALQALHEENVRLGLYEGVYAIDVLEQENRLLRARNDRLEKELAMYQVQRLGQEIQPERDYERGFIDGMQKQMQSSVDKAVNRLAQPEDKKCENCGEFGECCQDAQPEQEPVGQLLEDAFERGQVMWFNKPKDESMLYTTPPQRTTEQMRQWVGMTNDEIDQGLVRSNHALQTAGAWRDGVEWATKQLKDKNT